MSGAKSRTPILRPPSPTTAPPTSQNDADTQTLEIVFSFNTAGAYGPMHPTSKSYLKNLIRCLNSEFLQKILTVHSSCKTRVAIFAHGCHDKIRKKYGIKWIDFSDDADKLCDFVGSASPLTWGSTSHCYELVLRKSRSLSWTPGSRRVLVLTGCTRPHYGNHPGTDELIHWRLEARCLAQKGIKVYTVEVINQHVQHEFYREVAEITDGCHVVLQQGTEMEDVLTAIVSHLCGPEKLEDFEQELMERQHDFYSTDIAQLFTTLRQHDEKMTSPPGTPCLGTPTGSDFGDDDNDFGDEADVDDTYPSLAGVEEGLEERPNLLRRSSQRLKLRREEGQEEHTKTVRLSLRDAPSASLKTLRRRDEQEFGRTSLKRQQTVSFAVPEVGREDGECRTTPLPPSRSPRAGEITVTPLKKWKTAPVPAKNPQSKRPSTSSLHDDVASVTSTSRATRTRPALKKGVTSLGVRSRPQEGEEGGGRGGEKVGQPCSAKVYKIDREAPAKRENILSRKFTLQHLSWSPWKLVVSHVPPVGANHAWEARSDCGHDGYRRANLLDDSEDDECPALYELALKADSSTRKRVVFYKFLQELRNGDSTWEKQIFAERSDLQQEVSEALRKKCGVFLRRATFAQRGGRAQAVVQAALHKYDYAWNDVQGFRRCARPVDRL